MVCRKVFGNVLGFGRANLCGSRPQDRSPAKIRLRGIGSISALTKLPNRESSDQRSRQTDWPRRRVAIISTLVRLWATDYIETFRSASIFIFRPSKALTRFSLTLRAAVTDIRRVQTLPSSLAGCLHQPARRNRLSSQSIRPSAV